MSLVVEPTLNARREWQAQLPMRNNTEQLVTFPITIADETLSQTRFNALSSYLHRYWPEGKTG